MPARLINIKYITIRAEKVASPVTVLQFYVLAFIAVWRSGTGVGRINKVTLHRAGLVLGWVTVFGRANHLGM